MNTFETSSQAEELLRQRAEKYAAQPTSTLDRTIMDTVVVLGVGQQKIGVSSTRLEGIKKTPPIAHLPKLPPAIRGVMQVTGELIAAVDIARWFEISDTKDGALLAVVVHPSQQKLGLLIDEVIGFREIAEDELVESFFHTGDKNGRPITGTTRDLVAILDIDMLFKSDEIASDTGLRNRVF